MADIWQEVDITPDRIRINVSTSVKGIKTYDATIETWQGMDHALAEHDRLVAELDQRYPAGGNVNYKIGDKNGN